MPPNASVGISRHGKANSSIVCAMCAPGMKPTHLCRYKRTSIKRYSRRGRSTRCLRNEKVRAGVPLALLLVTLQSDRRHFSALPMWIVFGGW
jgi:hypothetical protein